MDTGEFFMQKNIKNNILLNLIIKSSLISFISVTSLVYLSSFCILHLNIPNNYYSYFAFAIVGISSFITSYFSTKNYSNNYLLLSLISCILLFSLTLINCILTKAYINSVINIGIIITICIITSLINSKYNKRF